ncbi:uncharacterized protein LOC119176145 isoform X1 [Rhipicephalus microplus]|uniref:uncharacterized protein LOC119176145 isoform X1 n=1 Tax=Rhipicephalus microplus TaxID=6941 RepID=UPI003F6BBF6A
MSYQPAQAATLPYALTTRTSDQEYFKKYCRVSAEKFELHALLQKDLTRLHAIREPIPSRARLAITNRALKVQLCQVVRLSKGMVINKELGVRSFDNDSVPRSAPSVKHANMLRKVFNVAELAQIPTDYLFWSKWTFPLFAFISFCVPAIW